MARLFRSYGAADLHLFAVGLVTSVLGRFANLLPPLVLGVAIDAVFTQRAPYRLPLVPPEWIPTGTDAQLWLSAGLIVVAFLVSVTFGWAQGVSLSLFSNRVQHRVRTDAYRATQRLDMAFFDEERTGELLSVLEGDVRNLRAFLNGTVSGAIQLVVTVVGIAALLFYLNAQLALVTLVAVPLLGAFTLWFMRTVRPRYRALRASVGGLNSRLETNIQGIEVIKSTGTETYEDDRVTDASWAYYLRTWDVARLEYLYQPGMDLLAGVAFATTFVLGGYWLVVGPPPGFSGTLLPGEFVTFLFMTQRFVDPLAGLGRIVDSYENARASGERIFGLMDRPSAVADSDGEVPLDPDSVRGRVEYDAVDFRYGDDPDGDLVLHDLSFVAEPGETVAFVGPTGAGKSTAAKLLLRLYDPVDGTVRLDGRDVRDYRARDLRRAVGYVSQDVFLFDGTVAENVRYGRFDATDDEVREACVAAEADRFVRELPDGYDTRVGERGVKLSGGQRQRIAIARALLQDPAVLVLDEATSAVDTATEVAIQRALDRLTEGRTTVTIAHRLSTVRDADGILVLEGGRVVERGTHDDLVDEGGLYATLWAVQIGETDRLPPALLERIERAAVEGGSDD
ncbi:ABC transporter ATP-binding protein [Haloglomus litoreum]|uniref:ABC transporter ATP-binding protein n=1 Tax=Haloglomus litoreum TaxID=3034026 RepID=UPI003B20F5BC